MKTISLFALFFLALNSYANTFEIEGVKVQTSPMYIKCEKCESGMYVTAEAPTDFLEVNAEGANQEWKISGLLKELLVAKDYFNFVSPSTMFQTALTKVNLENWKLNCFRSAQTESNSGCLKNAKFKSESFHINSEKSNLILTDFDFQIDEALSDFKLKNMRSVQPDRTTDFINMWMKKSGNFVNVPQNGTQLQMIDFFIKDIQLYISNLKSHEVKKTLLFSDDDSNIGEYGVFDIEKIESVLIQVREPSFSVSGRYNMGAKPKIEVIGKIKSLHDAQELEIKIEKSKIGLVNVTMLVPFILKRLAKEDSIRVQGKTIFIKMN